MKKCQALAARSATVRRLLPRKCPRSIMTTAGAPDRATALVAERFGQLTLPTLKDQRGFVRRQATNAVSVAQGRQRHRPKSTIRLPNGSLEHQVDFILSADENVPLGSIDTRLFDYCLRIVERLAKSNIGASLERAMRLLHRLADEVEFRGEHMAPHQLQARVYNLILRGWADCLNDAMALDHCQSLVRAMEQRRDRHPLWHPSPDFYTYSTLLYACAQFPSHAQALHIAETTIHELQALGRQYDPPQFPGLPLYNNLLHVYATQAPTVYGAAAQAEDWLLHMSTQHEQFPSQAPRPSTRSFNLVLQAWSATPEQQGARRAYEQLQLMRGLEQEGVLATDPISFGTVIHAFGRRGNAPQAQDVYDQALEHFCSKALWRTKHADSDDGSGMEGPASVDLTNCFNACLLAWLEASRLPQPVRDGDGAAARSAFEHVETVWQSADDHAGNNEDIGGVKIVPDAISHAHYLQACLQCSDNRLQGLQRADRYLHQLANSALAKNGATPWPNTTHFHTVINAWRLYGKAKAGDAQHAAEKAHALATLMLDKVERELPCRPTTGTFLMCMELWAKCADVDFGAIQILELLAEAECRQLTSLLCYQRAINAVRQTTSRFTDRGWRAYQVLQQFERFMHKSGNERLMRVKQREIRGLYTAVITMLAKDSTSLPDNVARAHSLLSHMGTLGISPTTSAYTAVISALGRLQTSHAAGQVANVYEELRQRDGSPNALARLDSVAYTSVLDALQKCADPVAANTACDVMADMLQLIQQEGRRDVECKLWAYDAFCLAVLKANDRDAMRRAAALVERVMREHAAGRLRGQPSSRLQNELLAPTVGERGTPDRTDA